MHQYLPDLKLIYIVRHPLDRIVSQWRHYCGRHPDCADFEDLMRNRSLKRLVVGCRCTTSSCQDFAGFTRMSKSTA